jgi:hypothetical protein
MSQIFREELKTKNTIEFLFFFFTYFRHYVLILMHWCNVWRNISLVHLNRKAKLLFFFSFLFFLMNNLIQRCANLLSVVFMIYIYYVNNENKEEAKYSSGNNTKKYIFSLSFYNLLMMKLDTLQYWQIMFSNKFYMNVEYKNDCLSQIIRNNNDIIKSVLCSLLFCIFSVIESLTSEWQWW